MKKLIITSAVLFAFFLTSCKKEHTCTCTLTYSAAAGGGTATTSVTLGKSSKKDAKKACDAGNVSSTYYTETCELK